MYEILLWNFLILKISCVFDLNNFQKYLNFHRTYVFLEEILNMFHRIILQWLLFALARNNFTRFMHFFTKYLNNKNKMKHKNILRLFSEKFLDFFEKNRNIFLCRILFFLFKNKIYSLKRKQLNLFLLFIYAYVKIKNILKS